VAAHAARRSPRHTAHPKRAGAPVARAPPVPQLGGTAECSRPKTGPAAPLSGRESMSTRDPSRGPCRRSSGARGAPASRSPAGRRRAQARRVPPRSASPPCGSREAPERKSSAPRSRPSREPPRDPASTWSLGEARVRHNKRISAKVYGRSYGRKRVLAPRLERSRLVEIVEEKRLSRFEGSI
jgi:hypothetical protein